jgi:hypothetical protein
MRWCLDVGPRRRADELIDDLANGVRVVITYFADHVGHR